MLRLVWLFLGIWGLSGCAKRPAPDPKDYIAQDAETVVELSDTAWLARNRKTLDSWSELGPSTERTEGLLAKIRADLGGDPTTLAGLEAIGLAPGPMVVALWDGGQALLAVVPVSDSGVFRRRLFERAAALGWGEGEPRSEGSGKDRLWVLAGKTTDETTVVREEGPHVLLTFGLSARKRMQDALATQRAPSGGSIKATEAYQSLLGAPTLASSEVFLRFARLRPFQAGQDGIMRIGGGLRWTPDHLSLSLLAFLAPETQARWFPPSLDEGCSPPQIQDPVSFGFGRGALAKSAWIDSIASPSWRRMGLEIASSSVTCGAFAIGIGQERPLVWEDLVRHPEGALRGAVTFRFADALHRDRAMAQLLTHVDGRRFLVRRLSDPGPFVASLGRTTLWVDDRSDRSMAVGTSTPAVTSSVARSAPALDHIMQVNLRPSTLSAGLSGLDGVPLFLRAPFNQAIGILSKLEQVSVDVHQRSDRVDFALDIKRTATERRP
jgi:hypothetical protein